MSNNRTDNVLKNSSASIIYKIVHMLVQFVMRTVFIRILGNEYTGISNLFTDIVQILSIVELGLDSSMVYALYKPLAEKNKERITALLKFYRIAFNIVGSAVIVGGICLLPFLHMFISDAPNVQENIRYIFMMYVITSGCSYFLIYKTVLLRADQKSRIIAKCSSVVEIVECISEIVLLMVWGQFYTYLILRFVSTIIRNLVLSYITNKKYSEYLKKSSVRLELAEKRKLFRDLACITVYNMAAVIINSTDSVFISTFVGTAEVAIIGNFTLIIRSANTTIGQIANATKASVGNLAATSSAIKQEIIFKRMNFLTFWASCFSCTCLIVLLNPFVGSIWLNNSYTVKEHIIVCMVINFFIAIMAYPVESFRIANGLFIYGWYRPVVMALLNIILDYFMGSRWGIVGILLATTISRVLTQVWFDPYLIYNMVFKKTSRVYFINYVTYVVVTVLSCWISYILCNLITISNVWAGFGLKLIIACIIPNLFVWAIYHKSDEFLYVKSMIVKVYRKFNY